MANFSTPNFPMYSGWFSDTDYQQEYQANNIIFPELWDIEGHIISSVNIIGIKGTIFFFVKVPLGTLITSSRMFACNSHMCLTIVFTSFSITLNDTMYDNTILL